MLTVSSERLANFLDVELADLPLLVEAGMPAPNSEDKFGFLPALHWFVQRQRQIAAEGGPGTAEENAERLRVENDLRVQEQTAIEKLQLDTELGKLQPIEPLETAIYQRLAVMRENILGIPSRYSHRLSGLSEMEIQQKITEIVALVFPKNEVPL